MACPCMVTSSGYAYRIHQPDCPHSVAAITEEVLKNQPEEDYICMVCHADLIHGVVVGMHAQGCELEVPELQKAKAALEETKELAPKSATQP